jgi:hypothetical protein
MHPHLPVTGISHSLKPRSVIADGVGLSEDSDRERIHVEKRGFSY